MRTRSEHIKWCKDRAIKYVDNNNINDAFSSMVSDLTNHPETSDHMGIGLGSSLYFSGHLKTASKMREFINGFN